MQAVLDLPQTESKKTVFDAETKIEKVFLQNVSWETYQSLFRDLADESNVRVSYDDGRMEIFTMESAKYAKLAELLSLLVISLAENLEIDLFPTGSTTFRKEKGKKGFEGDASFYFQNAEAIVNKDDIDLAIDPPPELIIEVDITNPSLPRFPIFAAIGVLEVWRCEDANVKFYRLQNDDYNEVLESVCLPNVKSDDVKKLVELGFEMKLRDWMKMIRELPIETGVQ